MQLDGIERKQGLGILWVSSLKLYLKCEGLLMIPCATVLCSIKPNNGSPQLLDVGNGVFSTAESCNFLPNMLQGAQIWIYSSFAV